MERLNIIKILFLPKLNCIYNSIPMKIPRGVIKNYGFVSANSFEKWNN